MTMLFSEFSRVNEQRCNRWHPVVSWSLSDWATATAGELGEACNVIKKLNRLRDGVIGNEGREADRSYLLQCLAEELADTATYLDLLATAAGIDLGEAIAKKFDRVSEKNGFPERAPIRCGCGNPIVAGEGCTDATGMRFCGECKEGFDGE